ncbi:MAG: S8 family serine peptidase [Vicinamibacterales bacterium]
MSTSTRRALRRAGSALAAATALWVATPSGQPLRPATPARLVVNDVALPGMDRGLAAALPPDPVDRSRRGQRFVAADGTPRALYRRGSVIVKFREGAGTAARAAAVRAVGAPGMLDRPAWADFDLMAIPMSADPEAVAAELAARPDVEYAQARYRNDAMFRPNDQFYGLQWNLTALDMERAWDINPGASSEVTVAVLDGGVAFRDVLVRYQADAFRLDDVVYPALGTIDVPFAVAPDLGPASRFVAPRDFIWDDDLPVDLDGHGTHVAGTIGQATNNGVGVAGMAFNVRIMPVKVIAELWDEIFGSPNVGTDDVVARAVRYAADNGAHVINMSIGREAGGPAPAIESAVQYAVSRGVFVAIAAGNDGDGGNRPSRTAEIAARIDGAVAVGAVGRSLDRAFYSTTGSYVEIAAPGGDTRAFGGGPGGVLQQTLDQDLAATFELGPALFRAPRFDAFQFYYLQGTSMATPHVAGFAALLRQQGITAPAAIEAAMKRFATDRGPAGRDDAYGEGLINPRATLRGLGLAR